ncbi:glycosyltransferase [Halobacillus shinanisalinarum]|uniref:Glycosyltransferase n=1 Tax=Halobacillus shinanisalinarum TaxID=2932258 RepID=A0ABY4H2V6_9BACI|nr:glycosyltransferase [Halobacillus shinanisalinarum]UOQ94521.1 glycosyltransferase [Halobacillus shinanisalinarum]
MINLLFIAEDTSRLLNKNFYYLEQELSKVVNLTIWRKPGHISYILKQLPTRPDFILLLNDIDHQMTPMIKGLANTDIPTGLFVNDVHRFTSLRRNYIAKHNIPYLFTVVRDKFIETYPEFKNKMEWFPHFVNTELCRDYGLEKDINLLMMGAVNDFYPLRQKIMKTYEGNPDFVYHNHPGYREFSKKEEGQKLIGHVYGKELNRTTIFFTCPSVLNYPVLKYFEALACKTLLLAPTFKELEDLGFIPGVHFVPIDEDNFQEKAAAYLKNDSDRLKVVEQGYHFIRQRHSVKRRTQQLVQKIESILH